MHPPELFPRGLRWLRVAIGAPGAELGGTKPEHMRLRHEADKGRVLQQPDTELLAACGIVAGASLLLA